MTETRDSLLQHYEQVRGELLDSMRGLSDPQMTETTLDGWSIKDNLAHLALWDDLRADEVLRISAGFESALKMTEQQDADTSRMAYELRRGLSLAQVLWEMHHSRERVLGAIAAAPARALDAGLYGEAGLRSGHDAVHAGYIRDWRRKFGI
jgi:hypothetical protein